MGQFILLALELGDAGVALVDLRLGRLGGCLGLRLGLLELGGDGGPLVGNRAQLGLTLREIGIQPDVHRLLVGQLNGGLDQLVGQGADPGNCQLVLLSRLMARDHPSGRQAGDSEGQKDNQRL